ncbi:MAG TPA: His/Gly/Thr/Pro-type tRNA ligase C-terminal domain-containing protein, partial [archaeon]|nr:His/Gly/Thr/Pro-type tRNA ligase C-terminal domain-containing protein [archaeon]
FVQVNNRKLLAGIIEESGIPAKKAGKAILAIDKLEKITTTGVQKELAELGVKEKAMEKLFSLIETTGGFEEVLSSLEGRLKGETALEGLGEAKELLSALKEFGVEKRVTLSVNLARGLEYYTGTVFEAFLEESGIKSAIAGGGRYDKMIGSLIESKEELPAVGISFGLDVLFEALKEKGKARTNTNTKVFVLPIRTLNASTKLCQELRNAGVPSEVDLMDRSISKNLEYASAEGIPFVLILGQRELEKGTATLRDMASGKQEELKLSEVVNSVKQRL